MNLLATPGRRKLLFGALYLSEGAPIGFLWWALPARLKSEGLDVAEITALTALLAIPWAFKFLWAPLVDVLRPARLGYRAWIVPAQLVMGATLLPLLWLDLRADLSLIRLLLLAHALAAATQDVAIDALAIASTRPEERGSLNGVMQAAMLASRSIFGAGVLALGAAASTGAAVLALVALVWSTTLFVLFAHGPEGAADARGAPGGAGRRFAAALREALGRRNTWMGLAFAAIGGAAFEAAGAVAGPFLIDQGLGEEAVGAFYLAAVAVMLLGALAGGWVSDRAGRRRTVLGFLLLTSGCVFALALAVAAGAGVGMLEGLLLLLYFVIGLFTASSYALFMDITDRRLGATQFSAYMGGTNLCESWAAFGVGRLHAWQGYAVAFATMAALSLWAVLPLGRIRLAAARNGPEAPPGARKE